MECRRIPSWYVMGPSWWHAATCRDMTRDTARHAAGVRDMPRHAADFPSGMSQAFPPWYIPRHAAGNAVGRPTGVPMAYHKIRSVCRRTPRRPARHAAGCVIVSHHELKSQKASSEFFFFLITMPRDMSCISPAAAHCLASPRHPMVHAMGCGMPWKTMAYHERFRADSRGNAPRHAASLCIPCQ